MSPSTSAEPCRCTHLRYARRVKLGAVIAGKFRLERVIGRGAMGMVVEATDVRLGRRVAVKFILDHHADNPAQRGRFLREAQAMTRLTTEHVAKVFEVGELEDGMLYLVMEYLHGDSLDRVLQRSGALPVAQAADVVLQALDAVNEAHGLGLVHRDLKPANLFLAERKGKPPILKVLDFGIVKDSADAAKLTATGMLPGTPAYMAPEQITFLDPIDARTDVWALGVTLFELLTTNVPWTGEVNEVLTRICTEATPRIRGVRSDVSPAFEKVVERCLAKRHADRYGDGTELAAALSDLRDRGLLACDPALSFDRETMLVTGRERDVFPKKKPRKAKERTLRAVTLGIAICTVVVTAALAMRRGDTSRLAPARSKPAPSAVKVSP
jgi:serine/threonine protein kinase